MKQLSRSWRSFRRAKKVVIISVHLAHAHANPTTRNAYNFVDSCALYMMDHNRTESACRVCFAEKSCRQGTELLKSIPLLNCEELPEFLAHPRETVRVAAKQRLEEFGHTRGHVSKSRAASYRRKLLSLF